MTGETGKRWEKRRYTGPVSTWWEIWAGKKRLASCVDKATAIAVIADHEAAQRVGELEAALRESIRAVEIHAVPSVDEWQGWLNEAQVRAEAAEARVAELEAEIKRAAETYVVALDVSEQHWRKELEQAEACLAQAVSRAEESERRVVVLTEALAAPDPRLAQAVAALEEIEAACGASSSHPEFMQHLMVIAQRGQLADLTATGTPASSGTEG